MGYKPSTIFDLKIFFHQTSQKYLKCSNVQSLNSNITVWSCCFSGASLRLTFATLAAKPTMLCTLNSCHK